MFLDFVKLVTVFRFNFGSLLFLVHFLSKTVEADGFEYSFCAHNVLYTFTNDACPGGVLFKKPIKIDEPCHQFCFGGDLKIYSSCRNEETGYETPSTPSGCSQLYGWNGEARILIPGNFSGVSKEAFSDSCFGMPTNCRASVNTVVKRKPLKILDMLKILNDAKHNESSALENKTAFHGEKTAISSTPKLFSGEISSEKDVKSTSFGPVFNLDALRLPSEVETQEDQVAVKLIREAEHNETETVEESTSGESEEEFPQSSSAGASDLTDLLRYIESVKGGRILDQPPNTKTFKLIKESVKIAQKLIPNHIIKDEQLYEAYLAFSHIFRHLDEDEKTDHHWNDNVEDFDSILLSLQLCYDDIPTLSFKTSGQPQRIQSVYVPQESGVFEQSLEIPIHRAHKYDEEDSIVGTMWKIVDIVHSTCHQDFKSASPSTQFNFLVSIEDLFLQPTVQKRWYNSPQLLNQELETQWKIISHPDLRLFMKNLDAVDAAAHLTFGFQFFLKKPHKIFPSVDVSSGPERGRKIKRQVPDFSAFEIYGGEAYCLQNTDEKFPASLQNSYPSVQKLCMK